MRFKSRPLLRALSLALGALVLGLGTAFLVLALLREEGVGREAAGGLVLLILVPGVLVARFISSSFSTLDIDERGLRFRKLLGGSDLDWGRVGSIRYWEQVQVVHGAEAQEYFVEVRGSDGRRLLLLKSTFERAAYAYLLDQAKARDIRIDRG